MRNPVQRAWSFARMFVRQQITNDIPISTEQWIRILSKPGNKKRTDYKKTVNTYEKIFSKDAALREKVFDKLALLPKH